MPKHWKQLNDSGDYTPIEYFLTFEPDPSKFIPEAVLHGPLRHFAERFKHENSGIRDVDPIGD
jgi:hypothetical protein